MKFMMSLHGLRHHWEASFFVRVLKRIDPTNIIEGFEVNGNPDDPYDREYIYTLAKLMKSDPRTLQFHSHFDLHNHYDNLEYLNDTLKFYNEISEILGYDVSIVLHPVDSFDIEVSMSRTRRYINNMKMLKKIHKYKVYFTLENLNNTLQHNRINTPEVQALLQSQHDLGFCWDIGHEVSENICTYKLNSCLVEMLSNVHIHDINKKDHYPFNYGRTDYKRAIDYLSTLNYDGSIIVEINLDFLEGNSLLEKFRRYMSNIDKLKSYYQTIPQVNKEKQLI